jgi:isopentenyl phosphate kinase
MCGDIVLDARLRGIIVSTEALLSALTNQLDPRWFRVRRVLWLGETEGVLDAEGNTVARVEAHNIEEVLAAIGGAAGTDVTGGMRLRVETAWELAGRGVESRVLNGLRAGCLASALAGGDAGGTVVVPHAPTPS